VILYPHDLDSLSPRAWITDTVIEFLYEVLEIEFPNFGYIRPGILHFLALADRSMDLSGVLPVHLLTRQIIFLPINDHSDVHSAGGAHWSLAVYEAQSSTFYYYDSLDESNLGPAQRTCQRFHEILLDKGQNQPSRTRNSLAK
jgi:Ulp1 family protease